jgi:GR25 family glycosyltransferase involved in LPS biosynthesis
LDVAKVQDLGLVTEDAGFGDGFVACALSHRRLYQKALTEQLPIMICEDDAIFRHDFATRWQALAPAMPPDWDILCFGYNFDSALAVEVIPGVKQLHGMFTNAPIGDREIAVFQASTGPVIRTRLLNSFGALAYVVSAAGAAKILRDCFPLRREALYVPALRRSFPTFSLDCMRNLYLAEWNAYALFPPLAISPNDKATSDTTHPRPKDA